MSHYNDFTQNTKNAEVNLYTIGPLAIQLQWRKISIIIVQMKLRNLCHQLMTIHDWLLLQTLHQDWMTQCLCHCDCHAQLPLPHPSAQKHFLLHISQIC